MAKWPKIKLGDVCDIERGGSPRPIDKFITENENGVNWIKIGDTTESMYITKTAQKIIPEGVNKSRFVKAGDFLLSNSMSFGRPYILKIDGCIHDGWLVLRDKNVCFDKHFLYYNLSSPVTYEKFKSMAVGGVVNNLNTEMVKNLYIAFPPLEEQRRIASILDKVTDLIAKRRAQLEKLDLLVKSRFVEMFGDPVKNPKNWNILPLKLLGECKNGMNFHSDNFGVKIRCLGVSDFKDLSIINDVSQLPTISLNEIPNDNYLLKNGDIVFVRSNGNKNLVGRSIVVYPNNTLTTFSGFCIRFRILNSEVSSSYLLRVFKTESIRKKIVGRGANIQNLNQKILFELNIPVPPLSLQKQFANFVEQTETTKSTIQQSLETLETLKKALMQEYFA